jgi:hypothetical protein
MLEYLKKKLNKRFLKRTFREYGYEIKSFTVEKVGEVEYAQWQHPFEESKEVTTSNIGFYQSLVKPGALIHRYWSAYRRYNCADGIGSRKDRLGHSLGA